MEGGRPASCPAGPAQPGGQPSGALLASEPSGLDLLCTGPRRDRLSSARPSTRPPDGGQTWQRTGRAPPAGTAWFLSGSPSGALLLATSRASRSPPTAVPSWSAAGGAMPPGGSSTWG